MASSKVMASTSPANPDLPRQYSSSLHSLTDIHSDHSKNLMDDLLKNICNDSNHFPADHFSDAGKKTVDEVWKDIVTGTTSVGGTSSDQPPPITLEDFLTKAGAVREEDVKGVDDAMFPYPVGVPQGFGNGYDGRIVARGKRRAVEETVDKATQQKQRRMIKNRESAARSRERKQAYTVELESIVTQLEEENARLLQEEAEQTKERFKQLMQNLIPVVEKKRPPRVLRRVHSISGLCSPEKLKFAGVNGVPRNLQNFPIIAGICRIFRSSPTVPSRHLHVTATSKFC